MVKTAVRVLAFLAFLVTALWVYVEPNRYDSWAGAIASLVVLLGSFISTPSRLPVQNQNVGDGSFAIQAGGDVKITKNAKQGRPDV